MRDPSWVAEYGPKTAELVKKHGDRDLVRGGANATGIRISKCEN
jgi:uncharacterized protein (DUF1330 family)